MWYERYTANVSEQESTIFVQRRNASEIVNGATAVPGTVRNRLRDRHPRFELLEPVFDHSQAGERVLSAGLGAKQGFHHDLLVKGAREILPEGFDFVNQILQFHRWQSKARRVASDVAGGMGWAAVGLVGASGPDEVGIALNVAVNLAFVADDPQTTKPVPSSGFRVGGG